MNGLDGDVEYNSEVLLVHVMTSHLLRSFSAGILFRIQNGRYDKNFDSLVVVHENSMKNKVPFQC